MELDGLRGLAALTVFLYHALDVFYPSVVSREDPVADSHWEYTLASLAKVLGFAVNGRFAVIVFFVLSGFVLTLACLTCPSRHAVIGIAQRLFRLLPVVSVGSLLGLILIASAAVRLEQLNDLNHVTRAGIYPDLQSLSHGDVFCRTFSDVWMSTNVDTPLFNSVLWTIGIELRASVFLMLWVICFRRCDNLLVLHFLGLLLGIAIIGRYYLCFSVGIALADLYHSFPGLRLPNKDGKWIVILLLAFAGVMAGNYHADLSTDPWFLGWIPFSLRNLIVYTFGAACVMLFALCCKPAKMILRGRLCGFLGRVSFAMYAIHQPILHSLGAGIVVVLSGQLGYDVASVWATVACLFLTMLLATFLSEWVDRPFNAWSKKVLSTAFQRFGRKSYDRRHRMRILTSSIKRYFDLVAFR